MAHPSVKQLSAALVAFGAATATFTARALTGRPPMADGFGLCDETFGKRSFVFVDCPDRPTRLRLESFLARKGFDVNRRYSPKSACAEVRVGYFKGWHWDE